MRVLFNETDLRPLLLREANKRLSLSINPDYITDFTYEEDDTGDFVGVVIEFEAPEPAPNS